jgi:hypothetical protein
MPPQTISKVCLIYEAKVSKLNASNLGSFDLLVERFAIPACNYRAHGHIRQMTLHTTMTVTARGHLCQPCTALFHRHRARPRSRARENRERILPCLAALSLSSCAGGRTAGEHIADMPHWMGGLPADAPPRRGTPEYDAWMAARAQDAARPKTEQQQPK